jgi:hypothetical protein
MASIVVSHLDSLGQSLKSGHESIRIGTCVFFF